ncbi:MAG: LytTR family transcriptional regulator DNA-binding domain-containing protein [Oscillospiraceae bacterium]|nr:LytTR family transcriptional regulator DNA-binding domain-containing protein [Oscillospiraceae bacterium]
MFKISIKQIDKNLEEEVVVKCHDINDEVLSIVQKLKKTDNIIIGSKDGEVFRLAIKDIFYIESVDNKTFIYCLNNVYQSKQKLYEIEEQMQITKLFRCSKSMIVNLGKIRSVSSALNGRLEAKLANGEKVIISRQYVSSLKKRLGM